MSHSNVVVFVVICASFCLKLTLSLHIVPERTEVTYINEKYLYNVSANVVRYGRRSTYYYNLEGGIKHTWGNNITVHLMFFEAQNNQYKSSLFELHLKLCDLFQRDQFFGKMFGRIIKKFGMSCPFAPGMYHFTNTTMPAENIPNVLPFQRGKVDVTFSQLPTQDIIGKIYTIFSVKMK